MVPQSNACSSCGRPYALTYVTFSWLPAQPKPDGASSPAAAADAWVRPWRTLITLTGSRKSAANATA